MLNHHKCQLTTSTIHSQISLVSIEFRKPLCQVTGENSTCVVGYDRCHMAKGLGNAVRFNWDMKHLKHLFLHIRILNLDKSWLCVTRSIYPSRKHHFFGPWSLGNIYVPTTNAPPPPPKLIGSNMAATKLKTQYLVHDLKACWGSVKWSFTKIGSKGLKLPFPLNNVYKANKLIQSVNKI